MSSDADEHDIEPTQPAGRPLRPRTSPFSDILNSPIMQLQRSLAAQQALIKPVVSIPSFSAALTSPSTKVFQDIQKMVAAQRSITSELADTAFALRTAQNRVLSEVQAAVAARDAITNQFRQVTEATASIRNVFAGSVLPEIRSMLAARDSFASHVRDHLQAITKSKDLISNDVLSSIRSAMEARSAIAQQLQDTVRGASAIRVAPTLQAVVTRLSSLRLNDLGRMAEELDARDALFASWSTEGSAALAAQLEADIAAHPKASEWSIEEQINYLIDWTQRQDNSLFTQSMISLLINLIAAAIFWLSVEVVPGLLSEANEVRPQTAIREVRIRIQEQPLPSEDIAQLRIVSRRFAPVRASRRRRSQKIATLRAGEVVHLCEKHGKCVLVEWTDLESGLSCEGWMLSKHLAPVRKKW